MSKNEIRSIPQLTLVEGRHVSQMFQSPEPSKSRRSARSRSGRKSSAKSPGLSETNTARDVSGKELVGVSSEQVDTDQSQQDMKAIETESGTSSQKDRSVVSVSIPLEQQSSRAIEAESVSAPAPTAEPTMQPDVSNLTIPQPSNPEITFTPSVDVSAPAEENENIDSVDVLETTFEEGDASRTLDENNMAAEDQVFAPESENADVAAVESELFIDVSVEPSEEDKIEDAKSVNTAKSVVHEEGDETAADVAPTADDVTPSADDGNPTADDVIPNTDNVEPATAESEGKQSRQSSAPNVNNNARTGSGASSNGSGVRSGREESHYESGTQEASDFDLDNALDEANLEKDLPQTSIDTIDNEKTLDDLHEEQESWTEEERRDRIIADRLSRISGFRVCIILSYVYRLVVCMETVVCVFLRKMTQFSSHFRISDTSICQIIL